MFIGFMAHWIPSEQIECRRVRTASGSDRIIKPSSKSPEHKSRHDLIKGDCRDPVATACRRVRTASGSDRIIKPSSKSPEHKSRRDLIKGDCRDPVATACRRVRTASGSDRIIKPSSKSPEHKSRHDLIKGDCRDPVATARGSDTQDRSRTALADYDLLFAIIESNAL